MKITIALWMLAAISGVRAARSPSAASPPLPANTCPSSSGSGLFSLDPVVEVYPGGTYCFMLRVAAPKHCNNSYCCKRADLDRIEFNVKPGCNASTTRVLLTVSGPPTKVTHAFATPTRGGPPGGAVFRLDKLGLNQTSASRTQVCLTLSAVNGNPAACTSLAQLCVPYRRGAEGVCSVTLYDKKATCCSVDTIGDPVTPPGAAFTVSSSPFQAPWDDLRRFADPHAQWIWSSPAAATAAPENVISTFTRTVRLGAATNATLHIIPDNRCDVFVEDTFIGTVVEGWRSADYQRMPVQLRAGASRLSLRCTNTFTGAAAAAAAADNAAGVLLSLIEDSSGRVLTRGDSSWAYTTSNWLGEVMDEVQDVSVLGDVRLSTWYAVWFADKDASWIWNTPSAAYGAPFNATVLFTRTFTVPAPTAASLHAACDDACDIFLNRLFVGSLAGAPSSTGRGVIPITLVAGANTLVVRAVNAWEPTWYVALSPAGLLLSVMDANGTVLVRTDASWFWAAELHSGDLPPAPPRLPSLPPPPTWQPPPPSPPKPRGGGVFVLPGGQSQSPWNVTAFADPHAQWIWSSPAAATAAPENVISIFTKTVRVSSAKEAMLHLIPDNRCDVFLNKAFVATIIEGWSQGIDYWKLPLKLHAGYNHMSLQCTNAFTGDVFGSPAGLLLALIENGTNRVLVRSGPSWDVQLDTRLGSPSPQPSPPTTTNSSQYAVVIGGLKTGPWDALAFVDLDALFIWSFKAKPNHREICGRGYSAVTATVEARFGPPRHHPYDYGNDYDYDYDYDYFWKDYYDDYRCVHWSEGRQNGYFDVPTNATVLFSTTVKASNVMPARLHLIADNAADVFLNGAYIASVVGGWLGGGSLETPIPVVLRAGINTLTVRGTNQWVPEQTSVNPAAILATLLDVRGDVLAHTDGSWTFTVEQ